MNTLDRITISLPVLQDWQEKCKAFVKAPDVDPAIVRALVGYCAGRMDLEQLILPKGNGD